MAGTACDAPGAYRPHRARDSSLHRLAEAHHETFTQVYDERFAGRFGLWRAAIERALWAFLDCGIEERGFARVRCDECRREFRHRHALVSAGVFNRQGEFTPLAVPAAGVAEERFRRRVIRMLMRWGRLEEDAAEALLAWRHSGFSVHHAIRVEPHDPEGVERLCR